MRRDYFFLGVLLLLVASCSDDHLDVPLPDGEIDVPVGTNVLKASLPTTPDSRLSIDVSNNKGELSWEKTDAFKAFDATGKTTVYSIQPESEGAECADFLTSDALFSPKLAVYPSWFASELSKNEIKITLPSQYEPSSPSRNVPMVGIVKGTNVRFNHLVGLLRINFANLPHGYSTIKLVTDCPIAGSFKIQNIEEGHAVMIADSSALNRKNILTITQTDNTKPFYVPLPPGQYGEIHVYAVKGKSEYQLFDAADKEIRCGYFYNIDKDYLQHASAEDFQLLMKRVCTDNFKSPSLATLEGILQKFNVVTGKFSDINYKDSKGSNWKALAHLERLNLMASAYIDSSNKKYFGNEQLFNQVASGLTYWTSPNAYNDSEGWWNNKIAQPKQLGVILIKMRAGKQMLSSALENKVITLMKEKGGNPYDKTGANRADIAMHWIYRACLASDAEVLTVALHSVFSAICYTSGEGFQHDGGFFQHGQQIYIGGYGDEILKSTTQVASLVHGTPFAMEPDKIQILSRFLLDTYYQSLRGKYMPYGILGRSVSRPGNINKSNSALYAQRMKTVDPGHTAEYDVIINRLKANDVAGGVKAAHKHFFRSDYTLHVRPNYTFDVRMSSKYTCRSERGNGENLKGYFIADGSTNILVTGKEYLDIFPVWKWSQIPGVTAPFFDNSFIPDNGGDWGILGTSEFAGGVSDGLYGASAYAYEDNIVSTGAHKSWFFFDDEVVCTGSVHSQKEHLQTTINQCFSGVGTNAPLYSDGQVEMKLSGDISVKAPKWVYNNHVGYVFPRGGNVWMRHATQSGTWKSINKKQKDDIVSSDIFSVGFNHNDMASDTYAYIVIPGISSAHSLNAYCDGDSSGMIDIIKVNEDVQSVYHNTLRNWQTVFFKSGACVNKGHMKLQVDRPCIVMIKEKSDEYQISIADPARRKDVVKVSLTLSNSRRETITADFGGSDIYAGKTLHFSILK